MKLKELIFVSLERWDDIWRRNQFLCDGWIRRHPEGRILFVEPPMDVSNAVRHGRWRELGEPRARRVGEGGRIHIVRALKFLPNSWALGRRINQWMAGRYLRQTIRRHGFMDTLLWINAHSEGHLAGRLGERGVIYDVTDDWTSFEESSKACGLTRQQDEALCAAADAVIVCSERLLEMKRPRAKSVHLIPNGVDSSHYARVCEADFARPADTQGWGRPVLGYTGSIHAERVDVALVEALARRLPNATIALVGPNMLGSADRQRLGRMKNIVFTGARSYAEIPAYMAAFDVCITPHLVTPFTESLNPIKLWEYLASGKPIVSTPVAGFRDFPQFVHLAADAEGFAQALFATLREDPSAAAARRSVAQLHSWEERLNAVEGVFDQVLQGGQKEVAHV